MSTVAVVVLAGGASRRFGADKLEHLLAGRTVLDRCLDDLPRDWRVVVVGPPRELETGPAGDPGAISGRHRHRSDRARGDEPGKATPADRVRFVREQPAGSGPASALVTGVRTACDDGADLVVVVPGDLPAGGRSAVRLVDRLHAVEATACVAVDAAGRDQPLQLALCGEALRRIAAAGDRVDGRARDLLDLLPATVRVPLEPELTADIDTPADAARWS